MYRHQISITALDMCQNVYQNLKKASFLVNAGVMGKKISFHYHPSETDRLVPLLAKSLRNALLEIRTFTQFLCNIWSKLPTQAWSHPCQTQQDICCKALKHPNSAHAGPSKRKWPGRLRGCC